MKRQAKILTHYNQTTGVFRVRIEGERGYAYEAKWWDESSYRADLRRLFTTVQGLS